MPTTGQQAALFAVALFLVAVGAIGTSDALQKWGFPPIAGFYFLLAGIIGSVIIKAYGLQQQSAMKAQLKRLQK